MSSNIFKISRVESPDQTIRYIAEIDAKHPVFNGHFPQAPVVPGVCTLSMLKECLSDALSRRVGYDYIKECKFLSAIIPSQHKLLDVIITIKQEHEPIEVFVEVMANEIKMIKLKATLR